MKKYDLVIIGTGSAMNLVEPYRDRNPRSRVAVIDKDPPGGICLNKGCVPSKLLLYPAELVRTVAKAAELGVEVKIGRIDFRGIMHRMRRSVHQEVDQIRKNLIGLKNLDYFPTTAQFTGPGRLQAGDTTLAGKTIVLCLGSRPHIPAISGLDGVAYLTSETVLGLDTLPGGIAIIGGGYIAAEYGHFFAAMGAAVTVVGRNLRFLPQEEPEVSEVAERVMSRHMTILTGHEATAVARAPQGGIQVLCRDMKNGAERRLEVDQILVAAGRESNSDLLHPERAGIRTDAKGWIVVDQYLRTTAPNVWALGDATGKYLFKHVANYESQILYYNAFLNEKIRTDFHAVPHAVFSHPEVAAVGMTEKEAVENFGADGILIGFHRYRDTTKGDAMALAAEDYFVKAIVQKDSRRILGAHIVGPQASVLIQEVVTLMYSESPTVVPITAGMHIHPALSEVVDRAFISLMAPDHYHHLLSEGRL